MNKKIIWGIIVVAILGAGWMIARNINQDYCWPYCPNITDADREAIKHSALEALTKDWKTFTNEEFGFEIKYPIDWKVLPTQNTTEESRTFIQSPDYSQVKIGGEAGGVQHESGSEVSIYAQSSPRAKTLDELKGFYSAGRGSPQYIFEKELKVDGTNSLVYTTIGYGGSKGKTIALISNNTWIQIDIISKEDPDKIFAQVVPTFRFTNSITN